MSISGTVRKAGPFNGNGVTVAFPFTFKVFSTADVLVVQTDASGVETTMVSTTNYTVVLNSNQDSNPGGTVTMNVAPPTGYLLTLGSTVANTQPMVLTNTGGFFATVINDAMDRVTILVQQLLEKLGRAVTVPISTPSNVNTQLPSPIAGRLLGWNATGDGLTAYDASSQQLTVSGATHATTSKATPVNADELPIADSAASFGLKKLTFGNLSSNLAYNPTGTGAVATTVQSKLQESLSVSVKDFGAKGDSVTDDLTSFNAALVAAKTNGIKTVVAPYPSVSYKLSATPTEQDGVSLAYEPPTISGAGRPAKGVQLAAIEGVSQDNYRHALAHFLQIPLTQTTKRRYWTIFGAVDIPPGATLVAGDVTTDCVATSGQARCESVNGRIWGIRGAVQSDQAAASDTDMGSAFGAEFDINNNTGRNADASSTELVAVQFATGGTNRAMAAGNISRGGTSQFYTGFSYKNGALYHSAHYYRDVGPTTAFNFCANAITNSAPMLSCKYGQDAIFFRSSGSDVHATHEGRVKSTNGKMIFVCGPSGISTSNNADNTTLQIMLNDGTNVAISQGNMSQTVATAGTIAGLSWAAGGYIQLSNATQITNILAGTQIGQTVEILVMNAGGCTFVDNNSVGGAPMLLQPAGNWVATQFSSITLTWQGGSWVQKSRGTR